MNPIFLAKNFFIQSYFLTYVLPYCCFSSQILNRSWRISTTPNTTKKKLFGLKLIQQSSMVILSCFGKKNQNLNLRKKSSVYY